MSIKRLASALTVLAMTGLGLALASPAQAQDDDCKTVASTLTDRPDSAVGGGTWALDQLERTVKVCQVEPGVYHAVVSDAGTFATVELDHTPAGVVQPLPAAIEGTVEGGFTADFEAEADFATFDPSHLDGVTIAWVGDGSDLSSGEWVVSLFGDEFTGSSLNDDWSWSYRTWCGEEVREEWVNQTDALGGNKGDITEVPDCPAVSPSPSVSPSPEASESPAPGAAGGTTEELPATGVSIPRLAGFGVALLGIGVAALVFGIKARRTTYVA